MTGLDRGLMEVPPLSAASRIAETLRAEWRQPPDSRLDLEGVLDGLGIELLLADLGGGAGGPQGLLTPLKYGGYRIEVDPTLPSAGVADDDPLQDEIRRHRTRFIIAHELAHTLFYWEGRNGPERLVHDSDEQEQFCDALASTLLVPAASARGLRLHPDSVVSLHRSFDVSIEVAARALIEAHRKGVAWLMVVPDGQEEPWVQWGAERTRDTVSPWRLLTRLADRTKDRPASHGRLRWRGGQTTLARGLYLAKRRQLVVTARSP